MGNGYWVLGIGEWVLGSRCRRCSCRCRLRCSCCCSRCRRRCRFRCRRRCRLGLLKPLCELAQFTHGSVPWAMQASAVDDPKELCPLCAMPLQPGLFVDLLGFAFGLASPELCDRDVAIVLVPSVGLKDEELLQDGPHRITLTLRHSSNLSAGFSDVRRDRLFFAVIPTQQSRVREVLVPRQVRRRGVIVADVVVVVIHDSPVVVLGRLAYSNISVLP